LSSSATAFSPASSSAATVVSPLLARAVLRKDFRTTRVGTFKSPRTSGDELYTHSFRATPDYLAGSLRVVWNQGNAKSASDLDNNLGRYLGTRVRDIEYLALVIAAFALKRNPCRLAPTPAHRLASYLELFAWFDHRPFLPQKD
jgi:hypothetical protein